MDMKIDMDMCGLSLVFFGYHRNDEAFRRLVLYSNIIFESWAFYFPTDFDCSFFFLSFYFTGVQYLQPSTPTMISFNICHGKE
jgi:hypothetical protein